MRRTAKKFDKFRLVEFFYPLRKQWYIINNGNFAIVISHQPSGCISSRFSVYQKSFRNDDIYPL